jgi:signal transduction histidine kinase
MEASYEPTDLATLTAELASVFRSAMENAGLRLIVDCPPLPEPIYVDRDLWEKIVLNLLSNALKFTFEGEVEVRIRCDDHRVLLTVRDTGIGVGAEDLPRMFERFHRVRNARSRTHEGTGIGLALVRELARLHGGDVSVTSEEGRGTTFTVHLPRGNAHLPGDRIQAGRQLSSTSLGAMPFLQEALRSLPADIAPDLGAPVSCPRPAARAGHEPPPCVLVVDDNADMRQYLRGLLEQSYRVALAADGEAALAEIRTSRPDLVVTDVMMPRLDGFGLLAEIRADERLRSLPVIVLSARAGEEARIEGLSAGADDYLIKPFTARELMARVASQLEMARMRQEADRRKDEFLATLAHELRTPLAPICNSLSLLRLSDKEGVSAERVIEMMERQVQSLVRLVDDLMEMSRITRGKIELRRERVPISRVIHSAIETSMPLLQARQHALATALPTEELAVDADPVRLEQVLVNLLNNAAKYTEAGGRIWIEARREGSQAVLTVRDSGAGISAEILPRIFEPFTQAERTYNRSQGGLGIGLTLVRSLVELHGGTVRARSEGPGQGSEFTVRLPLSSKPARQEIEPSPSPRTALHGRRMVVVDDNRDSATSLAMLLRVLGAQVQSAHDGPSALAAVQRHHPSVALVDIGMPEMDGYELARRLREQPGGEGLTVIALSGWGQPEDRERSRQAGIDHHLVKPVSLEALERLLEGLRTPEAEPHDQPAS